MNPLGIVLLGVLFFILCGLLVLVIILVFAVVKVCSFGYEYDDIDDIEKQELGKDNELIEI